MLATTQRSEWDETTLEQLGQALHSAQRGNRAAAIESALMAFEFDTAQALLEKLLQELTPHSEEPAPCTPP
jgi:outer membrane PBP1 activator LpoA protein